MGSPLPSDPNDPARRARREDDAALVARVRAGEKAALEEIFRAYAEPLCAFAFRTVRSRDVARELVQDLFLAVWAQRTTWRVSGALSAYLFHAVRNRALNVVRHERYVRRFEDVASAVAGDEWPTGQSPPPDATLYHAERAAALAAAIAELPARVREVLRLVREERRTYAQVAKALGVSVPTVERDLGRAIDALRRRLASWRE
jgi:RNA polymerase sigma-70 factor (ECF subfamily)